MAKDNKDKKEVSRFVVSRIVLKIKDKEISLTPEEAKDLKKVLSDILGEDKVTYVPTYPYRWYPYTTPYWTITTTGGTGDTTWSGTTVYCSSNSTPTLNA